MHHTEESLRKICYDYYQANQNVVESWHVSDYVKGAIIPPYTNIRCTAQQLQLSLINNRLPTIIWSRAHIEGIILCRALNLKAIQVIEAIADPDGGGITLGYYCINQTTYQQTTSADFSLNVPTLIVSKEDLHFVPLLASNGVNDLTFISPLRCAILNRNLSAVKCLLALGKPVLIERNRQSQPVFHTAILAGHLEIIQAIYEAASNQERSQFFSDQDAQGDTVWHLSIRVGDFECFSWLLDKCLKLLQQLNNINQRLTALINVKNYTGEIPLQTAVRQRDMRSVDILCHTPSLSFWNNNEGHAALQLARSDQQMPPAIVKDLSSTKINYCINAVEEHLKAYLNNDKVHKPYIHHWVDRLEKILSEEEFADIREKIITTPIGQPLQKIIEKLAAAICNAIRDKYKSKEDIELLKNDVNAQLYQRWDFLLKECVLNTIKVVETPLATERPGHFRPSKKSDRHRAFTRALKAGLRDYFYVSRALYEGEVLKNDETFNSFKAIFNISAPAITEVTSKVPVGAPIGIIMSVLSASLELISQMRKKTNKIEAGRFVQAFGDCGPNATAKGTKNIEMDTEKLKIICEVLYQRYRDQIEQCTVGYEADTIKLTPTSGVYVLAKAMADRIFQHIITEGSLLMNDEHGIWQTLTDKLKNLGKGKDVYREDVKIALPARCVLAVVLEQVGTDTSDEVELEGWVKNKMRTKEQWYAGGILSKTGLKLERNHQELYIRTETSAEESLHSKYGFCYVSEEMETLNEMKTRGFTKASNTLRDERSEIVVEEANPQNVCSIM